ncbi:MAG: hypothetical protein ABWY06_21030 [Pseudomonas sp.]|uniref:hypothetical protein n=1 Tax=Pseudomonas sp. TaxID=306 RepID=UPI00339084F5
MPTLDPQQRLAARQAILNDPAAQDCTVYRADERDPQAEEIDLGDARILFTGPFQAPDAWDAQEREAFFGDSDPELFVTAFVECEAKPATAQFFVTEIGDYIATMPGLGEVVMYYVHDCSEDPRGRSCVLIRDDEELD